MLTVAGVLFLLVLSTFPREAGLVHVHGIGASVTLETDIYGVPTIRGESRADVLFGLGYAHARDRLWQMEFQRRIGSGTLAEILGQRLVKSDRFLRTVGFRRAAAEALSRLSPEARALLDAYVAGVNQYLASSPALPIEFRLLRVTPAPFEAVDCLLWAKMMSWDLAGNATSEIRRARFVAAVGPERAADLFPPVPPEPTILRDDEWMPQRPGSPDSLSLIPSTPSAPWPALARAFASIEILGLGGEALGSNSFVLAGSRTKSGRPILANDPHLGLRAPSVWYVARLDVRGDRVSGATLPGLPGVIIGHNSRIAWALTSLEPDVQDLFVEEADPRDPQRYFHKGSWRRFASRTEIIRVRGGHDVTLEVRSSAHGPIVTDALEGADRLGGPVALRWTGLDAEDHTSEGFLAINSAADWGDFLAAAARIHSPGQNLLYADSEGHIGYTACGAVPIRPRADGLSPVPGSGSDDWSGYIPFEELPRAFDPPRGYIVTANNRVVSDRYPYSITSDPTEPYRARRITDRILAASPLDVEGVRSIQLDRVSYQARDLLPMLADTVPSDEACASALARLSRWNREFAPDSVPASIYAAWYAELSKMPLDELKDTPAGNVRSRFLINALESNSDWCDDARTPAHETCADFKRASLARAVTLLRNRLGPDATLWRWDRLHRARFAHGVFESVALFKPFFSLEAGAGGDSSTVNVGAYRRDGTFLMTDGPSYRQIVDFADLSSSLFVHTTGQSGNVFDRHYRDLVPLRSEGRYFRIGGAAVRTLTLEPLPK